MTLRTLLLILHSNFYYYYKLCLHLGPVHILVYLTNALDIREILEFKSSVLETGVDNPQRYYLSSVCNQVLGTNSIVLRVPSMHSGYYTYLEHRYSWTVRQWECSPCNDDDRGWVCDIQCPRRRVLFRSNQWWHDDGWFRLDSMVQIVSIRT